jgi:hypothetical protein
MFNAIGNFLYSLDRAIASLFGARSPEESVSSEIGRHAATDPIAEEAADVLDAVSAGHVESAVATADKLEAA